MAATFMLQVNIQRQTSCQELWAAFDILFPERNKLTNLLQNIISPLRRQYTVCFPCLSLLATCCPLSNVERHIYAEI